MAHRMAALSAGNNSHVALPRRYPRTGEHQSILLPPVQSDWKGSHCSILQGYKHSYLKILKSHLTFTDCTFNFKILRNCSIFPILYLYLHEWLVSFIACSLEDACMKADRTWPKRVSWVLCIRLPAITTWVVFCLFKAYILLGRVR